MHLETPLVPIILHTQEAESEKEQIHRLVDRRVDGILLIPSASSVEADHFNEIIDRKIPTVCLNVALKSEAKLGFVGTDEWMSGKSAAEFFLEKGHKNFCVIKAAEPSENLDKRVSGFWDTIENADKNCAIWNLPSWSLEENLPILIDHLKTLECPSAFFCVNDVFAAMLYKAAEKIELKIPDDLSVIGFADLAFAKYLSPSLTTLYQDGEEMGRIATNQLLELINEPMKVAVEMLSTQIIERDSVKNLN